MFTKIEEGLQAYKVEVKKIGQMWDKFLAYLISDKFKNENRAFVVSGFNRKAFQEGDPTFDEVKNQRHKLTGMEAALGLTEEECKAIFREVGVDLS